MKDALEQLAEETIEELLKSLPAEKLVKRLSASERLKGLSLDELRAALSPEMRAALAQPPKDDAPPSNSDAKEPEQGESNG